MVIEPLPPANSWPASDNEQSTETRHQPTALINDPLSLDPDVADHHVQASSPNARGDSSAHADGLRRDRTNASPRRSQKGVRYHRGKHHRPKKASIRSVVQRVSQKAAMTTKKVVWDSNDISVDAAVRAVDQWEAFYHALRHCTIVTLQQAQHLYQATKMGASKMEQGLLRPVRDWIVLPAFCGMEQAVLFCQSDEARGMAAHVVGGIRRVPVLGESVLAPSLLVTAGLMQHSWQIIQYPIPSKEQVRDSVDWALNSSKWALWTAGREVFWYIKRADASITRTLFHTQWKVLGSGPYATLDQASKEQILSHITERYCSLHPSWNGNSESKHDTARDYDYCIMARYELAAHVKRHNPPLYADLIQSGLLLERGGQLLNDDEWLKSPCPIYRHLEAHNFLIGEEAPSDVEEYGDYATSIMPLWFRLPYLNGKPPAARDAPWICFAESDQHQLEDRYRLLVMEALGGDDETPASTEPCERASKHPTIAQWYDPKSTDVLVDQKRHAVSLRFHPVPSRNEHGDDVGMPFLRPPPVTSVMRPTMWRFHGPGDEVRRSNWFMDSRHGLQPFDEEGQAVLEDAFLFLKWLSLRKRKNSDSADEKWGDSRTDSLDTALLTVDVTCPDGKCRLIQFGSLTQATAIQKGLSAAVSINKVRVYRGAWLPRRRQGCEQEPQPPPKPVEIALQESIFQATEQHGTLGETLVPNVCLRSILKPPVSPQHPLHPDASCGWFDKHDASDAASSMSREDDLAAPTARLFQEDMAKHMKDPSGGSVGHLCLIVHGIGEMMQSIDLFGLASPNLSTIVDCCAFLRQNHTEVQPLATTKHQKPVGRVEYLPVEWHEAFSILSRRRSPDSTNGDHVMMQDVSLPTIPNMREFANDTLMDVLYFMSPEHHDIIVDIVTNEMNVVVNKFCELTGFSGGVSIFGHSLGSIISWDILANQRLPTLAEDSFEVSISDSYDGSHGDSTSSEYNTARSDDPETSPEIHVPQPDSVIESPSLYPQLAFKVDNFFLVGSPLAVFLMIRNQRKPLHDTYFLSGCRHVFNIFHPYDPVAYRIEPCLDPRNAHFEPTIIEHWNGGFRVQYQTKRLWRKLLDTTWETQQNMAEAFEASMAGIGVLDPADDGGPQQDFNEDGSSGSSCYDEVVTGSLNCGERIDFMLQEKEIENANEYVAALAAHSSYWSEKDLSLFIARQIEAGAGESPFEAVLIVEE